MTATRRAAFPASGPAAWPPLRPAPQDGGEAGGFTGILDRLATAPVAAWSVARVLRAAWLESPLIRLRRASDNAESDFGADPESGDLDTAAVATWIGGGSAFVVRIYDQSGNARDVAQATASNQPAYATAVVGANTRPSLTTDTSNDFLVSASAALSNLTGSGVCLHMVYKTAAGLSPAIVWKGAGVSTGGWQVAGNGSNSIYFNQSGTSSSSKFWFPGLAPNTSYVDTFNYSGGTGDAAVVWRRDGAAANINVFGALTLPTVDDSHSVLRLGAAGVGASNGQSLAEIVLFAAPLSVDDLMALNANADTYFND